MNSWLLAIIIGAACGLVIGVKIARDSNREQPVLGGLLAQVFHYLACAGLTGMPPFIIAGIIVGLSFLKLFGTAVGFLAVTGMLLLIYAAVEPSQSQSAPTRHT
ncbi:MAG: hypothetical protein JXQ72_02305 [Anaerolineae bacterium]|nr:hypothetical protein [Anaerolineae bacterium]